MTIGDTIMKALNVIQTNGWCKFIRHDQYGRVCALGAVESALDLGIYQADFNPEFIRTVDALARYVPPVEEWVDKYSLDSEQRILLDLLEAEYGNHALVACYNNTHTQQEVEELFEKAARNEGLTL